jgi:glyoxylase-like metal-dependent hydrolase (beta-lactamase superfamily II)
VVSYKGNFSPAIPQKPKEGKIMEEVAEKTYRLEVRLAGVDVIFAVYLIGEAQGVVIEPGPAAGAPTIQAAMKQLGMKELAYIIPTHIHLDHAGAAGSLAQLFPRAKVLVHPQVAKHMVDPSRLIESTKMSFGDDFEATFGTTLPVPESQIKTPEDGETISVNDRRLRIIYAPGHAPHHMAIFDEKIKGLFCGEALGTPPVGADSYPIPIAAPPSFDIEVYVATMEKLRKLNPRILFYSHDGIGRQPDRLIPRAVENTRLFGDLILEALRRGETDESVKRQVREYLRRHLGVSGEGVDVDMSIDGFIFYFKKMGLV